MIFENLCHLAVCIAHCNVHVVHEVSTFSRRRSNTLLALALRLAAQLLPGLRVGVVEVQRLLVHWNKFSKVSASIFTIQGHYGALPFFLSLKKKAKPHSVLVDCALLRIFTLSGLNARQRLFETTLQRLHRLFHLLDLGLELSQNGWGHHRVRILKHVPGRRRKTLIQKEIL